ncbi:hypothetical protein ACOSQ3_028892 [Xanthoceras sorbifolium]
MILSETFQVAAVIEKLPPAWKDFKNYLKHKRKEMNLEELIVRLRIEEDNKRSEKKGSSQYEAKTNVVELGKNSKFKSNKSGKGSKLGPKGGSFKKHKFQGKCFNCDKMGHKSSECRLPKKKKNNEANAILSSNYLLNKVPRKKQEKTPYELWKGRKPSYKYLRIAYRFLVYKSQIPGIHNNTIMESRNASFFEHVFPYRSNVESSSSK